MQPLPARCVVRCSALAQSGEARAQEGRAASKRGAGQVAAGAHRQQTEHCKPGTHQNPPCASTHGAASSTSASAPAASQVFMIAREVIWVLVGAEASVGGCNGLDHGHI